MKETVLVTGANSFIAKHLVPILQKNYRVKKLSRNPNSSDEYAWDPISKTIDQQALDDVQYIVHLAGAKLNDGSPLTHERQKLIRESRIGAADFLRNELTKRGQKLIAFVSASAIGYYGFTDKTLEINEEGEMGSGFTAELCRDWEMAADLFKTHNVADNVSKIRVSLVLGNDGGIFPSFQEAVKNDPLVIHEPRSSSFSWNHIEDMASIFAFAVQEKLNGVYNSVAPEPASTQDILKAISNETLDTFYHINPFHGKHLVSHKVVAAGFTFKYPNITDAVHDLIHK